MQIKTPLPNAITVLQTKMKLGDKEFGDLGQEWGGGVLSVSERSDLALMDCLY